MSHKLKSLGVTLDDHLRFDSRVRAVTKACTFHTRALCHVGLQHMLSTELAITTGCSIVESRLNHCNSLLYGAPSTSLDRMQRSQDMLGPCRDAEQQQNQCQAFAAVVTLAANPRVHQLQSRHSDVQGSLDVIAAVHEFTAERPRLVMDSQTFQHAVSDRSKNAYRTCQASVLCRCTCSMEQSASRHR